MIQRMQDNSEGTKEGSGICSQRDSDRTGSRNKKDTKLGRLVQLGRYTERDRQSRL